MFAAKLTVAQPFSSAEALGSKRRFIGYVGAMYGEADEFRKLTRHAVLM